MNDGSDSSCSSWAPNVRDIKKIVCHTFGKREIIVSWDRVSMNYGQGRVGAMEGQREWNSSALASPSHQRRAKQQPITPFGIKR